MSSKVKKILYLEFKFLDFIFNFYFFLLRCKLQSFPTRHWNTDSNSQFLGSHLSSESSLLRNKEKQTFLTNLIQTSPSRECDSHLDQLIQDLNMGYRQLANSSELGIASERRRISGCCFAQIRLRSAQAKHSSHLHELTKFNIQDARRFLLECVAKQ